MSIFFKEQSEEFVTADQAIFECADMICEANDFTNSFINQCVVEECNAVLNEGVKEFASKAADKLKQFSLWIVKKLKQVYMKVIGWLKSAFLKFKTWYAKRGEVKSSKLKQAIAQYVEKNPDDTIAWFNDINAEGIITKAINGMVKDVSLNDDTTVSDAIDDNKKMLSDLKDQLKECLSDTTDMKLDNRALVSDVNDISKSFNKMKKLVDDCYNTGLKDIQKLSKAYPKEAKNAMKLQNSVVAACTTLYSMVYMIANKRISLAMKINSKYKAALKAYKENDKSAKQESAFFDLDEENLFV